LKNSLDNQLSQVLIDYLNKNNFQEKPL